MSIFSDNLSYYRQKKHLTKADMAKYLSVTAVAYGYYESGQREPKISALYTIADALDVSVSQLLTARDDKTWAIEFKDAVDEHTGFLVSDITDTTVSITRVNQVTKESKNKYSRLIQVSENNTLTFNIEDMRELYQYCTQICGAQLFSNTMKSLFVQAGLANTIPNSSAFMPGREHESNFLAVDLSRYSAQQGLPKED